MIVANKGKGNMFVWGFSSHYNFSLIRTTETSPLAIEDLQILTYAQNLLLVIEQWGLFSVPHLLWHGESVYNSHLRGPVTFTPSISNGAVTTCFYDLRLSQLGHSACETYALTHCTTALVKGAMNTLSFHHLCKPQLMVSFFISLVKKKVDLLFKKKSLWW